VVGTWRLTVRELRKDGKTIKKEGLMKGIGSIKRRREERKEEEMVEARKVRTKGRRK
jgi:hypothetical protein